MTADKQYDFTDALSETDRRRASQSPRSLMTTQFDMLIERHRIDADASDVGRSAS